MRRIYVLAVLMALAGTPVAAQVFGSTGPNTSPTTAQPAGYIYAGPETAPDETPAFRRLVSADIPNNAANTTGNAAGITGKTFLGTGTKIAQFTAATVPSGNRCVQTDATGALAETAGACGAGAGTGTVTSIGTTGPLSGGTITTTGSLSCPTCVTAASALTQYGVVIGGGLQASSTIAASTTTTHALFATATAPAFRAVALGDLPEMIFTKSATIFDPVAGDSGRVQFAFGQNVSIRRVYCSTKTATSTVTMNLDERAEATPDTAGTNVLSASLVCDTGTRTSCASGCDVNTITNAGIAANAPVAWTISSVANVPAEVRLHVDYVLQ